MARPVAGKIHALPSESHLLDFTHLCSNRMASIVGQIADSCLLAHGVDGHSFPRVHR